jgi:hypothetical protein
MLALVPFTLSYYSELAKCLPDQIHLFAWSPVAAATFGVTVQQV